MQVLSEASSQTSSPNQLNLFDDPRRWPRKPYCTDDLSSGVVIRSLSSALKKAYIQANPPWLRVWSIHDLDYPGAANAWDDAMLPPPTWAAVNRDNGHAHLVYGLKAPVLVDSPDMRQAPLRYLNAIESMMREKLRADEGYSGLITKNPAHPLWKTLFGGYQYDLNDLAEYLPSIEKHVNKKRKPEEIGLGRNVSLFDNLRHWAYRNLRKYKTKQGGLDAWNGWLSACNSHGLERNCDFAHPLDGKEVWHIAKSVSKWTWRNFDIEASDARFSKLQAHRGSKGGIAKGLANESKHASARLMRLKGMTQQSIADELEVNVRTIIRWLA